MFTATLCETELLVLVESFPVLFAQFAFCYQLVEQLNLGKQWVVGLFFTPACKRSHKTDLQNLPNYIKVFFPAFFFLAKLAVEDELCSVESDVVCELKGPHGITSTKFHGDVDVFLGSVT